MGKKAQNVKENARTLLEDPSKRREKIERNAKYALTLC